MVFAVVVALPSRLLKFPIITGGGGGVLNGGGVTKHEVNKAKRVQRECGMILFWL